MQEGNTYIFDQSDSTNDTHQIGFSTNPNNSPAAVYSPAGSITSTGTPGTAGAKTTFNVAPVRTTGAADADLEYVLLPEVAEVADCKAECKGCADVCGGKRSMA